MKTKNLLVIFAFCFLLFGVCNAQWVQTNGPYGGTIITMGVSGTNLFASTSVGVFRSTNSGAWWTQLDLVLPGDPNVLAFGSNGTKIFAATVNPEGAFFSTDNGTSWHGVNGLPGFNSMCVSGVNLVAGTNYGLFLSTDEGITWTNVDPLIDATTFAVIGTKLFAGFEVGVFISTDNGATWVTVNPLPVPGGTVCLAAIDSNLFAGTSYGVFRSTDYGTTWTEVNSGLTNTMVGLLAVSGTSLFAGTYRDVFLSTNYGETWSRVNYLRGWATHFSCFAVVEDDLFAGVYTGFGGPSSAGIWLTTDNGTTWATANSGLTNGYTTSLTTSDTLLFAGTPDQGVFLSTDNGNSWTVTGPANIDIRSLAISVTNLFAGTWSNGIFLSTNNGTNWTSVNTGLPNDSTGYDHIQSIASSGQNLFASTGYSGVYISTNNGTIWTRANTPFSGFSEMALLGPYLFAGTGNGVFRSADNGTSWTAVNSGLTDTGIVCLAVSGTDLFAGTGSGVFLSSDNGTNWIAASAGLPNSTVRSLTVSGTNLFAETGDIWKYGYGVFLSTNNGTNWSEVSAGLPGFNFWPLYNTLVVNGTHLFITVENRGVWRRPLSEMITSIKPLTCEVLQDYLLYQNYPNPFNPSTRITYSIPARSNVSLKIFDLLGSEVSELVNGEIEAGNYEVEFNAANLPSGVYFYQLQAGEFISTKKMILLK
jgi:hypothetical protein